MSASMKLINFNPSVPVKQKRPHNPNTRTGRLLELIMRPHGITLEELRDELNKTEGEKLDIKKTRTWLAKSFLAPRGYGIESEYELDADQKETLRIYGKSLNVQTPGKIARAKEGGAETDVKPEDVNGHVETAHSNAGAKKDASADEAKDSTPDSEQQPSKESKESVGDKEKSARATKTRRTDRVPSKRKAPSQKKQPSKGKRASQAA